MNFEPILARELTACIFARPGTVGAGPETALEDAATRNGPMPERNEGFRAGAAMGEPGAAISISAK